MLNNSLFTLHMGKKGLNMYKGESTRDIICLEFSFGSRSYEDEMERLKEILSKATKPESIQNIKEIISRLEINKDKCIKKSKEEIREDFYQNGVDVEYKTFNKDGSIKKIEIIHYKMLYRTPSKAKVGQVMFITDKLYKKAYDWLTMGLGNKLPLNNAKIVELSAYAPLTTSTIIDTIHIPVQDILILEDQDSFFTTLTNVVKAKDYEKTKKVIDEEKTLQNRLKAIEKKKLDEDGNPIYNNSYKKVTTNEKMCYVDQETREVKNTLWDGMGLIESSILPNYINGMVLLRNHFFKMCGFNTNIQLFLREWCLENGKDYETHTILDMFGCEHKVKNIKIITTNNAIKWLKFKELMGKTTKDAYLYWCKRVENDGSLFGVVKTDHSSKLGDVQQLSYQMINTLPCKKEDVEKLASTSVKYVELLKRDNDAFEKFLRKNINEINHYEMLADLYHHNKDFANSKWFRYEKKEIIKSYVNRLRKGKITINADNLTICGNPYALLLYSVGEDWTQDPTINFEQGTIQCYTSRFNDGKYLAAFRNPHNSPNNICYLHNTYHPLFIKFFNFSGNILAINCINSDIQDRANGADEDSDFFFVTDDETTVDYAKLCYERYPTIVNALNESNITYENSKLAFAEMDNRFAKSRMSIGESSNLAQLAMTYYWTNPNNRELYDNFIILSVLAQVAIDSCKREYEVDPISEIERIKKMPCMNITKDITLENGTTKKIKADFPKFMKYTKEIKTTKDGKEIPYDEIKVSKDKLQNRINYDLKCPMNWLQDVIDNIQMMDNSNTTPTEDFFIKRKGEANRNQIKKIKEFVIMYDSFCQTFDYGTDEPSEIELLLNKTKEFYDNIKKIKINNTTTVNRLIELSLGIEKNNNKDLYIDQTKKYSRKILNCLYKTNKDKFINNFTKK